MEVIRDTNNNTARLELFNYANIVLLPKKNMVEHVGDL